AQTMYFRLTKLAGSEATIAEPGSAPELVPGLEHLRLVLDSPAGDEAGGVQVFERVAGARLDITGQPREPVQLSLRFRSDTGRERLYERSVALDDNGHASLRVPYAAVEDDAGARAYELCPDSRPCIALRVDEQAVRGGDAVAVALVRD